MDDPSRADAVLDAALRTFARYGYRKTSMDEVARAARISRPGLYFLFASKQDLFRAAVTRALTQDLAAASRALTSSRPLRDRVVEAFDHWAGRYIGTDIPEVIAENPDLLGDIVVTAPARFEQLLTDAIGSPDRAQTLISTSIGLKHQVPTQAAYLERLTTAVRLIVIG